MPKVIASMFSSSFNKKTNQLVIFKKRKKFLVLDNKKGEIFELKVMLYFFFDMAKIKKLDIFDIQGNIIKNGDNQELEKKLKIFVKNLIPKD